ncbi:MAG: carboxylating nicotinate-nucleotide diphosphorylase [Acidobacteriota bacterium]
MIDPETMRRVVRLALEEDLGGGDITSRAVVDESVAARGRIVARDPLVVAGVDVAREVFRQVDDRLDFRALCADGDARRAGEVIALVAGAARSILAAERTALNFLQRMSGIASRTRELVERVRGSGVEIADTRKTAPGLRAFDKHAVRAGGGVSHRTGLYDAVLIKDNHWRLAGGVGNAVRRARAALAGEARGVRIEIEVGTLREVDEALDAGADAVLLDNMDAELLREAVSRAAGRACIEVSGGVGADRIRSIAALGVQRISLGLLTHSARAADIALELEPA